MSEYHNPLLFGTIYFQIIISLNFNNFSFFRKLDREIQELEAKHQELEKKLEEIKRRRNAN